MSNDAADLVYSKQGLFTSFIPVSKAGEDPWRQLAEQTEGTGKILTAQLPEVLHSLRKAGYTVRSVRASDMSFPISDDALLEALKG